MFLYFWMVVQVLCESLPISSSGHVALLLAMGEKFHWSIDFLADAWAFDYFLQGVSALLFLVYFFTSWWNLVIKKTIQFSELLKIEVWQKNIIPMLLFGIAADGITFLLWIFDIAERIQLPLVIGFVITGLTLWFVQFAQEKKDINIWSVENGLVVGFVQGCALLPGISRFATTFSALRWLGYTNRDAFPISFLIQWPLIFAGSLKGLKALLQVGNIHEILTIPFLSLTFIAGIIAYCILYYVQKIIDKNLFWKFSYYMIIPVMVALLMKGVV